MNRLCLSFLVCLNLCSFLIYSENYFLNLPLVKQSNYYTCGASVVQSILRYYGEDTFEIEVTPELNTNELSGTECADIVQFFNKRGYEVVGGEHMSILQLKEFISQGKPVVCLITVHVEGIVYGHYVIALGYDEENIYFMNSDYLGTYGYIPQNEFDSRWFSQPENLSRVEHWALAISKGEPTYSPTSILYIP